jgi:hypothetical protein
MTCKIADRRFIHSIVTGSWLPAVIFVVRHSDCSTNRVSGLNDLLKAIAAGFF